MHYSSPPGERNETAFFIALGKMAQEIKKRDEFVVIFHHDADGCASGAIAIKTLLREGKKVSNICLKQLYKEDIPRIKELGKNFLFVDFGSGQLDYLVEAFGEDFFVLDHHQPCSAMAQRGSVVASLDTAEKFVYHKWHVNPLLFGINGGTELSGAGTAFFFSLAMNEKNVDLSVLGVVGALGDMQDFNSSVSLIGLNRKILDIGVANKFIEIKKDLRLYGRISRPLVSFLLFSSNPILPGITAQEDNTKAFLAQLEIPLKDPFTEKWLTYNDLSSEQKLTLTSALIMHLSENNVPEWKIKELVGEVYTFPKENPHSPLSDGKEFATMLNACGRNKRPDIALQVCLGDRKDAYLEALALVDQHRHNLSRGIRFVEQNGITERKSFYFIDSKDAIDESIIGIIAGMLYGSIIQENKPIIALARNKDGTIKASGRGTSELVRRGLNIGAALKEIGDEISGVEGGGHCLHPNTLVQKSDGAILKISEIDSSSSLLSQSGKNLKNSKCTKVFNAKKKKIVSLKTTHFEIFSSEAHRFFKYDNFGIVEKKAEELKERDFILGVKKIPFEGAEVGLSKNPFVYLNEKGLLLLKNKRLKLGLTRKQLLLQVPSTNQKIHNLSDFENLSSHRIPENFLLELLSILNIPKKWYLNKFIAKKFECRPNLLNKELAWLAGYIQGDGYIDKKRIECKEPDLEIIAYFQKCFYTNFVLETNLTDMRTYKKLRVYSADLCRFFRVNFPECSLLSGQLKAPQKIMLAKNEVVAYYLRGLFDADGGAFDRFVYLDLVDKHLLQTVQFLLLRFGILSNIRETKVKPNGVWRTKDKFRLDITDFESLSLFKKHINFTKKCKKYFKLQKILQKQSKKKRNPMFFSPVTYKEMIDFLVKNDISRNILNFRLLQRRTRSKRMNYNTLEKHCLFPILKNKAKVNPIAFYKINWLNSFIGHGDLTFYEIRKKTVLKNKLHLIDLSVPSTKNFVANGLIVHNSIAAGAKIPAEKIEEFLDLLEKKFEEQLKN